MRSERRLLTRSALAFLAPALVSCAFILDFDELQTERGSGSGGTAGTAGTAGADTGGSGGTGECPGECFDDDPCTLDGCSEDGACLEGPVSGLVLDGVDETIQADAHFRTTIAAGPDAFFLADYSATGATKEVTFYRLDANAAAEALAPIKTLGGLDLMDSEPLSTAGLAVDSARGLIHAFIGMRGAIDRVWHVVLDMNYEVRTRTTVADTYFSDSPFNYPVVANLGGDVAAAWINADRQVSVWTGALTGPATLAVGHSPMTVTLLSTAENQPLVLYGDEGGGVFVESQTFAPQPIEECQTRPGGYLSSSATAIGLPGFWLAYWTKFGEASGAQGEDGFLTTDGRGLTCSALGCLASAAGECSDNLSNATRNVALATAQRPGDPTGLVHVVQLTPLVSPNDDGTELYAALLATASRVDFGRVPFETEAQSTELGEPLVLSALPTSLPNLAGPDFPTVAYVPPDRFAVSWIQPSPSAGSELRIQRYRLCAPE